MNEPTPEQNRLWNMWRSGQITFKEFQANYGEPIPDSVGRLHWPMGPMTKRRAEYLQKMANEVAQDILRRQ